MFNIKSILRFPSTHFIFRKKKLHFLFWARLMHDFQIIFVKSILYVCVFVCDHSLDYYRWSESVDCFFIHAKKKIMINNWMCKSQIENHRILNVKNIDILACKPKPKRTKYQIEYDYVRCIPCCSIYFYFSLNSYKLNGKKIGFHWKQKTTYKWSMVMLYVENK